MAMFAKRLNAFIKVIMEEAEKNEAFAVQLEEALGGDKAAKPKREKPKAKLDSFDLAQKGELDEARLQSLSDSDLRDIIAVHRMNPTRRQLKTRDALVSRIIEFATKRAKRGEDFLK